MAPFDRAKAPILAEAVLSTVSQPVLLLNGEFRVCFANRAFYEVFRVTPDETQGRPMHRLGNGQWDIPDLRRLLEDILPRQRTLDGFTIAHEFGHLGRRIMRLNARWIDVIDLILLAIDDVTEREEAEERARLLAQESEHRANNVLLIVRAVVQLTRAATVPEFVKAVLGRLEALARAHSLLSQGRWQSADLRRLVKEELAPYDGGTRVRIRGPAVAVNPEAAQTLGMALHELATNAAKYGALSVRAGKVSVSWSYTGARGLALRWRETGGPPVTAPRRRGFGTSVMERVTRGRLRGELRFNWRARGLVCEIVVPAAKLRPESPTRGH